MSQPLDRLVADNLDIWTSATLRKSGAGRGGGKRISLYGIERLRALILDLAVRGKLVPQDAGDEPASELLVRIPDDWAAAKRRHRSRSSNADESSEPTVIPDGWCAVVGNVILRTRSGNSKLIKGKLHSEDGPDRFPGYSASGQDVWLDDWEHEGVAIVLSAVGARCGKAFLARGKWSAVANTHIIWLLETVTDPNFAMLVLNNEDFWDRAGGAQPFVKVGNTLDRDFLLPPLAEQRRIVAKVDELMALCDALERKTADAMAAHRHLVEELLATLVNSATPADLAANWARLETHFDTLLTTDASIDALKQTILDIAVRGKLVEQDGQGLWIEHRLGKIIGPMDSGWSPACLSFPARTDEVWGVLKTTAVQNLEYQPDQNKELPEKLQPRPDAECRAGDILVTRAGPTNRVGICCYVPATRSRLMISDKIVRFRPASDQIDGAFLALALSVGPSAEQIEKAKSGMAASQVNISQAKLREVMVSLPPLAEQHRIVAKVDALIALCDALKSRLADAAQTRCHLADAITERAAA